MRTAVLLAVAMAMPSCTLFQKKKAQAPVIVPPSPKTVRKEPPKPITQPPAVATQSPPPAEPPPEVLETAKPTPPPPPPKPTRRARRPPTTNAQTPPLTPLPAQPAPQPPPPQLTTLVSPEEQQRLNTAIDAATKNALSDLARLGKLRLTGQQAANFERARTFLKLSHDARTSDLATALALAQRAETLARDLATGFR